jgi:hypothetical protein
LDRAVANPWFLELMPNVAVKNMEFSRSDHRPILLDIEYHAIPSQMGGVGLRWFEAMWLQEEKFGVVVTTAWEEALLHVHGGMFVKLNHLQANLHVWDHVVLKKPKKQLRQAQRELEPVMYAPMTDENEERRT